jgi:hypothetical protein
MLQGLSMRASQARERIDPDGYGCKVSRNNAGAQAEHGIAIEASALDGMLLHERAACEGLVLAKPSEIGAKQVEHLAAPGRLPLGPVGSGLWGF